MQFFPLDSRRRLISTDDEEQSVFFRTIPSLFLKVLLSSFHLIHGALATDLSIQRATRSRR